MDKVQLKNSNNAVLWEAQGNAKMKPDSKLLGYNDKEWTL